MIHGKASFGAACALFSLVVGCSDSDVPKGASASQSLTVPLPTINQYVIMAARAGTVGDRNVVSGGDIAIAPSPNATPNAFMAGIDSRVGIGEVLLSQRVVLRDRVIAGEIGANVIEAQFATTGPRSPYVTPPARPLPPAFTAGTTPVTVNVGQTTTLAAGAFGAVNVSGILNLSGGTYSIQSLRLNPDARLIALAGSTVRVVQGVVAADRSRLQAPAPQAAGNLRLLVNGTLDSTTNSLTLGTDVQLRALVVARNVFRSADRLVGAGAISAQDVIFGNDCQLAFNTGFGCTVNADCNDNNACTTDTCVASACVNAAVANGTACTDGNACTQADTCQAGVCTGASPVVCTALDQCHDPGTCSPANGVCSNPNKANGTTCSDANACTQIDTCQAGVCTGANPVVCATPDQCHDAGTCNPADGMCSNPNKANGTTCSDANACTQADTCQMGACQGGAPVVCTASNDCHDAGVCDPNTGTCSESQKPDGTVCNDGSACTQTDTCATGVCVGSGAIVCAASDECHDVGVCNAQSGMCSDPAKPDGTPCDDENVCSQGDSCQAGICSGGNDFPVTEFSTGLTRPSSIISGPSGKLWFVSRETAPEAFDGSVSNITVDGAVATNGAFPRDPSICAYGPDGFIWTLHRLLGGLPYVGRYDATGGAFVSDYSLGLLATDIASTNDGGVPVFWLTSGASVVRLDSMGAILSTTATRQVARAITSSAGTATSSVWFIEAPSSGVGYIGRIQFPSLAQFPVNTSGELVDLAVGSDGGVWFTDTGNNQIGRLSSDGASVAGHPIATPAAGPNGIASGPDQNLWFTMRDANKIGRITTAGEITEICIPTAASQPTSITAGPDGNVWFTEEASGKIGRVTLQMMAPPEEPLAVSAPEKAEDGGCNVASRPSRNGATAGSLFVLGLLAGLRRRRVTRRRTSFRRSGARRCTP
jgi:streptogramin lyase